LPKAKKKLVFEQKVHFFVIFKGIFGYFPHFQVKKPWVEGWEPC